MSNATLRKYDRKRNVGTVERIGAKTKLNEVLAVLAVEVVFLHSTLIGEQHRRS